MRTISLVLALCLAAFPACAQNINVDSQTLAEYNRVRPLQNPQYEKSQDVMARHILDNKNKVAGELQDVIVGRNGSVHQLQVAFDRLNFGQPVYVNYAALKVHTYSKAYVLSLNSEQLTALYPSLLADTATASGPGIQDDVSVRKMVGTDIFAQDGRHLGDVQDVLFNADGDRANLLYVTLHTGLLNGAPVAIPFSAATFGDADGKFSGIVTDQMADAMIDYASHQ